MGRYFWMKHLNDETHDKQPGCIGGLVHVLDYHHWHSNVRKRIQHRKYEDQTHDKSDWSPEKKTYSPDACEVEELLDEKQNPYVSSTKRSRANKRRSLTVRLKALIAEDTQSKQGFSIKSSLRRTYSIHHLESLDDDIAKICTDWQNPANLMPTNVETCATQSTQMKPTGNQEEAKRDSKEDPDVLDIFKVDKALFIKHLQHGGESVANFTRSPLGLNVKAKFSKSRSFPVSELSERRKFKPLKLENKQREVWSFPRENKSQTVNHDLSGYFGTRLAEDESNGKLGQEDTMIKVDKQVNDRSKYAQLFENSFETDAKLKGRSKSLKLTNEYGYVPMYFRRIHSISNVDSYYTNPNFEVLGDDTKENVSSDANMQMKESDDGCEKEECFKEEEEKLEKNDSSWETEIPAIEDQISEGLSHVSSIHEPNFPIDTGDIPDKIIQSLARNASSKNNNSDLYYVRRLLNQSGIAMEASEMTWHALDQPLIPQLFEQVEACWPHGQDPSSVWHHQILFDLVNEVLVEVYDLSLPYYPKALSSSCYVRPFPVGTHIIEEVCTNISKLMNLKTEEKQSLECIVGRDLARDHGWMNLQLETECIALDLEDAIINDLLEEVIFS